ncbi:MAG: hypothetical protein GF372_06775 [Candidatus Marinimicrobia bacterium]|nr:hypothetical protein [Candidatus Neomarinimicrobiota bacterium]
MEPELYQKMIKEYIDTYNAFNHGMLKSLNVELELDNAVDGDVTTSTDGNSDCKDQTGTVAENISTGHQKEKLRINTDYHGVLKKDCSYNYKAAVGMGFQDSSVFTLKDRRLVKS